MKKKWIFFTGMLTGGLLTIVVLVAVWYFPELMRSFETTEVIQEDRDTVRLATKEKIYGMDVFQYLAEDITFDEKSVKVFQVIQGINYNEALVYGKNKYGDYFGTLYLLEYDSRTLYDDQIIKIPKGMVLRLVGTFQYETRDGRYKTVPRVIITKKDKYERSADSI